MENELSIKNPMLLVGIGSVGSKIAAAASTALECKCLLISNEKKDLVHNDRCSAIFVGSGEWVNPSSHKLRSFVEHHRNEMAEALRGYATVIVVSNLAGRAGTAIAPIICKMAKDYQTVVISIAIMPFKYETDRIFRAGIALRRVREVSDSTIVMDNDAFLDNNPELSEHDCFAITNNAIIEVIASIPSGMINPAMNVLCTSNANTSSESSLRDSLAMLYDAVTDSSTIKRALVYVMGGKKIPIGELNKLVGCVRRIFKEDGAIEVGLLSSLSTSNNTRVHLVASAPQKTRFDSYDPLGEIIPDALDWDEPDSAPDIKLAIPAID
ncbi:MAG: cell division protein FtsZ [Thermoproteota archaeon]|nr:cell division protein FtsZ [Thermoproteota archaeon]